MNNPNWKRLEKAKSLSEISDLVACEYIGSGWGKANLDGVIKNIYYSKNSDTKLEMLAYKRCDFVAENEIIMKYTINDLQLSTKLSQVGTLSWDIEIHLLMSKKSKYINDFASIDSKFSKRYQKNQVIVKKWLLEH